MFSRRVIKFSGVNAISIALCTLGPLGYAHTTVRDEAKEGKTTYNALQIEHGCENDATGVKLPVKAQSVVFPTVNPTVVRSDGTSTTLSAEISDPLGLAGKADLVQDRNIFKRQNESYDANGNLIGFNGTQGNLQTNLLGLVPFQFTPVSFLPTSCAKRLLIQIAIVDICKFKFPPGPLTANLWIPNVTPLFQSASGNEGIGNPAVLTINRDLSANPLPSTCGTGYDVTVTPSNDDVDAHLPIKGWGKK